MDEFKIYSVSDKYISYLREKFPNVYSNKIDNRTHTRKYVGIVMNSSIIFQCHPQRIQIIKWQEIIK